MSMPVHHAPGPLDRSYWGRLRVPVVMGVLIALLILVLVLLVCAAQFDTNADREEAEFALDWITRAVGSFIATVAAVALLIAALVGARLPQHFAFVPALLAGLLLVEIHWALALSLGALPLVFLLRRGPVERIALGRSSAPVSEAPPL